MRALIQRVSRACVTIDSEVVGKIEKGILVFLGVAEDDTEADLHYIVRKTVALRIFADSGGKMNLAIGDVKGGVLLVSQFTLLADTRKGNRPSFLASALPAKANMLYQKAIALFSEAGVSVATGRFGADMQVELINDGPVTIWLDSHEAR